MAIPTAAERRAQMELALVEARACAHSDDVPVGAVIFDPQGAVLATGRNTKERDQDPLGHAEVLAIRSAAEKLGSWRLTDCTLVVTLEPCVMCAGAILAARIPTVVYGAFDEKAGAAGSVYDLLRDRRLNHQVEVISGIRADECGQLLTEFFREKLG
ncbi:tRNA(adenine34) deaminase [Aurantimicrobium minutum]|uniref:tRNA adenosine(34) deaminase TadA n=1 Tax=Aurantimicrobium minutum TaxID=708131 RepID=UPI0024747C22|nr:tRNA adenosine(34) deaminase TadA [Aurantimicrobium minutum]MDH6532182.1 tRNA(adenine34) deaminase [Aurantimicrobium minutum]